MNDIKIPYFYKTNHAILRSLFCLSHKTIYWRIPSIFIMAALVASLPSIMPFGLITGLFMLASYVAVLAHMTIVLENPTDRKPGPCFSFAYYNMLLLHRCINFPVNMIGSAVELVYDWVRLIVNTLIFSAVIMPLILLSALICPVCAPADILNNEGALLYLAGTLLMARMVDIGLTGLRTIATVLSFGVRVMLTPLQLVYWAADIMHSIYTRGILKKSEKLEHCLPVQIVDYLLFYSSIFRGSSYLEKLFAIISPFAWIANFSYWTFRNQGPDYWSVRVSAEDLQPAENPHPFYALPTFHAFWQTDCDKVRASVKEHPVPVLSFFFGHKDGGGSPDGNYSSVGKVESDKGVWIY